MSESARATPCFTNRTSFTSPSWFVLLRRTVTRTPSPSVESTTSAQRGAATSLRRMPSMNSSLAITASRRPRSAATWSDSTPRPRRRGRWQVASTADAVDASSGRHRNVPRWMCRDTTHLEEEASNGTLRPGRTETVIRQRAELRRDVPFEGRTSPLTKRPSPGLLAGFVLLRMATTKPRSAASSVGSAAS